MITEQITKLDAAQRQTHEAIRMFFEGRDTVPIHTLASAASQLLADLGEDRGFAGFTRNPNLVVEPRWKEWKKAIKSFENFFKGYGNGRPRGPPLHKTTVLRTVFG